MSLLIEGAVMIEAVLLILLTLFLMAFAAFATAVWYHIWTKETGGMKELTDNSVAKFFRRVKLKDGRISLVPYDEQEDFPGEEKEEDDELAESYEHDYSDAGSFRSR